MLNNKCLLFKIYKLRQQINKTIEFRIINATIFIYKFVMTKEIIDTQHCNTFLNGCCT